MITCVESYKISIVIFTYVLTVSRGGVTTETSLRSHIEQSEIFDYSALVVRASGKKVVTRNTV